MPHEAYGIEWPIYRDLRPKLKAGGRDTAFTLPIPQRTGTEGKFYWPPEALPFAYAWNCGGIALLRSREANAAYLKALEALDLPGGQAFLRNAASECKNTQKGISKFFEAIGKRGPMPILSLIFDRQYENDPDCQLYIERVKEFILVGFNRQIDRVDKRYKVIAEKALNLFGAILLRTIAEYCKVKLENWNKYRPDEIDRIMTGNPTTRVERLKKHEIRQIYKRFKWVLRHNAKLLKDADQWYKCRVDPGTIEGYLDELDKEARKIDASKFTNKELKIFEAKYYPSRSNIETAIAPCDEAIPGYRKWRK